MLSRHFSVKMQATRSLFSCSQYLQVIFKTVTDLTLKATVDKQAANTTDLRTAMLLYNNPATKELTHILWTQKLILTLSQMCTKTVHNFLQRLPFAWHSPSLFCHLLSHYAQKYHETQWSYLLKTGRDMDFLPRKCKGSTSKDNSANSWGTLQTQVQKPRMIKALRCEAQHRREELGRKMKCA